MTWRGCVLPEWMQLPVEQGADAGDAIIAALAAGGVDYVFFTSGSEIGFYQEAIAKAHALGWPAPRLITMTHEHASLNAALGYAAVSGNPAVTAAHVDAGTQHHGAAIHTAMHAGLPVLITAGCPPTSLTGTSPAARNAGGHLWLQETFDQHSIVRQYMKWDRRMQLQDNPGLITSRALQVAMSEPCGPAYLSIPPEVSMQPLAPAAGSFPSAQQLGLARAPGLEPEGAREIARRLVGAKNPRVVVSGSGRNPATVAALMSLCERLALPVVHSASRIYLCFPMDHPLMLGAADLSDADVVLVLEADVPWMPGPHAPGPSAWVAAVGLDPIKRKIPTYEFTADLRLTADPLLAIQAIEAEAIALIGPAQVRVFGERALAMVEIARARRSKLDTQAKSLGAKTPIDPLWLSYQIGRLADQEAIVIDDTLPHNRVHEYLHCNRAGAYFFTPGTSGGWATGAAFGAKLAAPMRDVIAVTGDGFYMFGTPAAVLWSAAHYKAPFLTIVYQNRSYATGTVRMAKMYPDGYAQKSGFDGGYFDPPMDYAKEAEACGAYGVNVRDPAKLAPALKKALAETRKGRPAVVAVWLARHLQAD